MIIWRVKESLSLDTKLSTWISTKGIRMKKIFLSTIFLSTLAAEAQVLFNVEELYESETVQKSYNIQQRYVESYARRSYPYDKFLLDTLRNCSKEEKINEMESSNRSSKVNSDGRCAGEMLALRKTEVSNDLITKAILDGIAEAKQALEENLERNNNFVDFEHVFRSPEKFENSK